MKQSEINEAEWRDKNNWRWYLFYYCAEDSRVWVPKKPKWCGWTLNFAKKQSYVWLFALLIIPVAIILFQLNL
jgi:uncharacterized membrane protein